MMTKCVLASDMRRNLIAMLRGDVRMIGDLIRISNNRPLQVAVVKWGETVYSIDSYQFSYVLYDALLYDNDDKYYSGRNILEMLNLHKLMCGAMTHLDYSEFSFINGNDDDFLDESDIMILKRDGVFDADIELTNVGAQHKEKQVIELLRKGASPYFINKTNVPIESQFGYSEVAMLLCHLDSEWCDQWDLYGLSSLDKRIDLLDDENLELIVLALFNAAASQRILYIVDEYISEEARANGEKLMRKYNAYYPILRHNPNRI